MAITNGKGFSPVFWLFIAVSLFVLNACGGGKKTKTESPVAVITLAQKSGVAPFKATLDGSESTTSQGSISAYRWNFPDGSSQSSKVASYTFKTSGTFNVSLTVENDSGLSNTASVSVNVVSINDRFSIQGVIRSLPFTDVDSDINDPKGYYASNNGDTPQSVQDISNPIKLNGFAAKSPTRWKGDRFEAETDVEDHFRVRLNEKDFVSLLIADFVDADLDLYLYKESSMELVAYSSTTSEYESLQVKESGNYIVVVEAVKGYSNYLLKIGRGSFLSGIAALGNTTDFEDNQIILKMEDNKDSAKAWYPEKAQMSVSHHQSKRAVLAKINPLNPQTHNMLWGKIEEDSFQSRLALTNPNSSRKLKTIKAIKHLKQQKGVLYAEPNYRVKAQMTPNDPYFVYQWHLHSLNMRKTWDITTGDPNVIIAIVDTGVYLNHPDLKNQLVKGYDFVSSAEDSNDGDGIDPDPTDPGDADTIAASSFHGTHVTGIAVGEMNNNRGIVGIAPKVKVMPLRAIGRDGGLMYDVLQAVRYAGGLENDSGTVPDKIADVINLSLGGPGYSVAPQDLFKEVRDRGIIVVASSGNQNTGEAMYPASYPGVISVGASEMSGERAYYSNTGINLDVMAYGGNMENDADKDGRRDGILSTMIFEENGVADPDYSYIDGTSMSSPQISAIAALMKSVYPKLTPELFDSLLFSGKITIDKGEPGRDDEYGYGLIDGLKAVEAAQDLQNGGVTSAITSDESTLLFDGATTDLTLIVEAIGNGAITITNFTATEPWLTIKKDKVNSSGIGSYKLTTTIADHNLSDGVYRAYVSFETDQNMTLTVEVIAQVGAIYDTGNAGFIYILLIDTKSGDLKETIEMSPVDGLYEYEFKNIPVGSYYVTAGSDIDNNGLICDYGETCGSYPQVESFEIFELFENKKDINFDVGLYTSADLLGKQSLLNNKPTK